MMNFLLMGEERERFAKWLEMDIESTKQILRQLEKFAQADLLAHHRQEMIAEIIVLKKIRSIHTETIDAQQ